MLIILINTMPVQAHQAMDILAAENNTLLSFESAKREANIVLNSGFIGPPQAWYTKDNDLVVLITRFNETLTGINIRGRLSVIYSEDASPDFAPTKKFGCKNIKTSFRIIDLRTSQVGGKIVFAGEQIGYVIMDEKTRFFGSVENGVRLMVPTGFELSPFAIKHLLNANTNTLTWKDLVMTQDKLSKKEKIYW